MKIPRLGWFQKRLAIIGLVLFVAWLLTIVIGSSFADTLTGHLDELERGIYFAWFGELIFFTIVGAVVAIVTMRDPSDEPFEERFKILYGKRDVPDSVSSYIRQTIRGQSGYYSKAHRSIILESFDPKIGAYDARLRTEYTISNLLDVPYSNTMAIRVKPDDFSSYPDLEIGRVHSIRVSNEERIKSPEIISQEGFSSEVNFEVKKSDTEFVSIEYSIWLKVGEPQVLRPKRVVEQFTMDIVNRCNQTARVEIAEDKRGVMSLLFNSPVALNPVRGVHPGNSIFSVKFHEPA